MGIQGGAPATPLEALLAHPKLWRARQEGGSARRREVLPTRSTGFPALDECLPGGGWPEAALLEILHDVPGIGELSLLLPALSRIGGEGRLVVCVAPPHVPCVPALSARGVPPSCLLVVDATSASEALWACEQALASPACGAALLWWGSPGRGAERDAFTALRRLQLAAHRGCSLGVVFRPLCAAHTSSPAPLRVAVRPLSAGLAVEVLKARGGRARRIELTPVADGPGAT